MLKWFNIIKLKINLSVLTDHRSVEIRKLIQGRVLSPGQVLSGTRGMSGPEVYKSWGLKGRMIHEYRSRRSRRTDQIEGFLSWTTTTRVGHGFVTGSLPSNNISHRPISVVLVQNVYIDWQGMYECSGELHDLLPCPSTFILSFTTLKGIHRYKVQSPK